MSTEFNMFKKGIAAVSTHWTFSRGANLKCEVRRSNIQPISITLVCVSFWPRMWWIESGLPRILICNNLSKLQS